MGSKKHKKHHKSDKKERTPEVSALQPSQPTSERSGEQPLRLVLKVGGGGTATTAGSASERSDSPHVAEVSYVATSAVVGEHSGAWREQSEEARGERAAGAKHKKSKKKKKKKSSDRERKHRHHHYHHDEEGGSTSSKKRKRGDREDISLDESGVSFLESSLLGDESLLEAPVSRTASGTHDSETGPESGGVGGTGGGGAGGIERSHHSREPRACTIKSRQSRSPLQQLLDHLLRVLEQRDPQQFFAWPVTDHIAPGYSSIIARPMDFSTMRSNIDQNEYPTLEHFRTDLKLLCDNAMTYNHPETIYYRAAKRMLHVGLKATSKEKLTPLRSTLSFINDIDAEALGFDVAAPPVTIAAPAAPVVVAAEEPAAVAVTTDSAEPPAVLPPQAEEGTVEPVVPTAATSTVPPVPTPVPTAEVTPVESTSRPPCVVVAPPVLPTVTKTVVPEPVERKVKVVEPPKVTEVKVELSEDGFTPDQILNQARKAARAAADMLTLRRPNCKFGFLRQHKDGSTSLAILNPAGRHKDPHRAESRKVCLQMLVGRLHHGSGSISGYREDRRNVAKPVNYLNYGNYASYAPSNDSTFANLSKDDSDLLYSTYGDETAVQYAESLLNFTKDCDFVSEMADGILNALTDGEHAKVSKLVAESKRQAESEVRKQQEDAVVNTVSVSPSSPPSKKMKKDDWDGQTQSTEYDIDALKSLADEGIDMSFLDSLEQHLRKDPIQKKLDETTCLLQDLARVQNARLNAKLPHHLAHVPGPSPQELELAAKVTEKLTELSRRATPADLLSLSTIRDAMGITSEPLLEPAPSVAANEPPAASSAEWSGDGDDGAPRGTTTLPSHGIEQPGVGVQQPMTIKMEVTDEVSTEPLSARGATTDASDDVDTAGDLEVELREFLETGPETLPVRNSTDAQAEEMIDRALAL